jgi:hypothetical protein
MKKYFLSKLSSIWNSAKLLFYLIFVPSLYAKSFNDINEKFTIGLDAFKFTTILSLFCLFIFNKTVGVKEYRDKIAFTETIVDLWLLIILVCATISIIVYITHRKSEVVNHFVGSVLFSFSSSFLIGILISTMSIDYYNTINPQTSFSSGDSFDHFLHGMDYYIYPSLFLFLFVIYITNVNAYAVKKSGIMTFRSAIGIHWLGIIISFVAIGLIGDKMSESIASWLQVLLSVFG